MAILRTETGEYIKILYNECKVIGNMMYVKYVTYGSAQDRETEKGRAEPLYNFLVAFRSHIASKDNEITEVCNTYNIDRADPNADVSVMPQDVFDELTAKGKEVSRLEEIEYRVQRGCYNYRYKDDFSLSDEEVEELSSLGYDSAWLENRIELNGTIESYCGEYGGEVISHELYYTRLKDYLQVVGEDV